MEVKTQDSLTDLTDRINNKEIHMPLLESQQMRDHGSVKKILDISPLPKLTSPILQLDEKVLLQETPVPDAHGIVTQRLDEIWKNTHRLKR